MKILYVTSEAFPYAKTGGLADVAGALPKALSAAGCEVKVVMPGYKSIKEGDPAFNDDLSVSLNGRAEKFKVKTTSLPGSKVPIYFLSNAKYFNRAGFYQENGKDYPDNAERFASFCMATLELCKKLGWAPDVINCNDWQTALIPVYLKTRLAGDDFFKTTATVYTIHNLGYQGLAGADAVAKAGIDPKNFVADQLEFYGKLNLMKGGLVFSDMLSTVSKTYSTEIQTPEFGCGLDGVLALRRQDLFGILNGLDYDVWNPEADSDISRNYSDNRLIDKKYNKEDIQKSFGLPLAVNKPLLAMISRLDKHKGFDLVAKSIDAIIAMGVQFVLLGTGAPEYHELFQRLHKKFPDQVGIKLGFDAAVAKKIYAGADIFLMPSHYEPCGLGQLISLRYGTVPVVRKTGGLADTIIDYNRNKRSGTGFVFEPYDAEAFMDAVRRACDTFREKTAWTKLQQRAMLANFSWEVQSKEYIKLYKKAILKVKKSASMALLAAQK